MRVLDLFSGIGGFSLGLEGAGMETVAFCEIEEYPRKVLAKHWPDVPCYADVRELTAEKLKEDGIDDIGLICGGYPCQPFSLAGKRAGEEDDRHLWPEMYRLIKTIRPRWVIAENVAGHISMGLDTVLSDLEAENYTCWPFVIPACAVDARHRRDRIWIIANSSSIRGWPDAGAQSRAKEESAELLQKDREPLPSDFAEICRNVADTSGAGLQGGERIRANTRETSGRWEGAPLPTSECSATGGRHSDLWPTEPRVGRVANGIPSRVDRLKGLGNAVVPQIPEIIGRAIMQCQP